MKKIFLLFLILQNFFTINAVCQKQAYVSFPDSSDSDFYFDLLFGQNTSLNGNVMNLVKIEFEDSRQYIIISKGLFINFYKAKFNIPDSELNSKAVNFLRLNTKVLLKDTLFFKRFMGTSSMKFYPISIMERFRKMKFVDFLNIEYQEYGRSLPFFIIAYLHEKRILYDLNGLWISAPSESRLRWKYKITWNDKLEKWEQKDKPVY